VNVSFCQCSLTGQASLGAIFQAAPILRYNKQKNKGQVLSLNSFTKMKIAQISWMEGPDRLDPSHQF
jgi:hypothetical protein